MKKKTIGSLVPLLVLTACGNGPNTDNTQPLGSDPGAQFAPAPDPTQTIIPTPPAEPVVLPPVPAPVQPPSGSPAPVPPPPPIPAPPPVMPPPPVVPPPVPVPPPVVPPPPVPVPPPVVPPPPVPVPPPVVPPPPVPVPPPVVPPPAPVPPPPVPVPPPVVPPPPPPIPPPPAPTPPPFVSVPGPSPQINLATISMSGVTRASTGFTSPSNCPMYRFTETATAGEHQIIFNTNLNLISGSKYTIVFEVNTANSRRYLRVGFYNFNLNSGGFAWIDVINNTITNQNPSITANVTAVSGTTKQIQVDYIATFTNTDSATNAYLISDPGPYTPSYLGDPNAFWLDIGCAWSGIANVQPPAPTPVPPPPPGTGSLEPMEIIAQYKPSLPLGMPPGRGMQGPVKVPKPEIKGLLTDTPLSLEISEPPVEFNTCVNGMKLEMVEFPEIPDEMKYNNWWLVASRVGINRLTPEAPVYFYWATQVAENEIGLVPANFSTANIDVSKPADNKIKTGFATLPYVWIDQLLVSHPYPTFPDECKK